MGILQSLFGNRVEYVHSQIFPMMAMMMIDGNAAEKEKQLVYLRLRELGVTPEEFEKLLKNPPPLTIPPSKEDRLRAIFEVCLVMLADGKVDAREMVFQITLCHKFGLTPKEGADCLSAAGEASAKMQPGVDFQSEIKRALLKLRSDFN
jgi:uncharacterized tellurite resistance protein B-like protein